MARPLNVELDELFRAIVAAQLDAAVAATDAALADEHRARLRPAGGGPLTEAAQERLLAIGAEADAASRRREAASNRVLLLGARVAAIDEALRRAAEG